MLWKPELVLQAAAVAVASGVTPVPALSLPVIDTARSSAWCADQRSGSTSAFHDGVCSTDAATGHALIKLVNRIPPIRRDFGRAAEPVKRPPPPPPKTPTSPPAPTAPRPKGPFWKPPGI